MPLMARLAKTKRYFLISIVALAVVVGGILLFDALRNSSFESRAKAIKIGDSKQQVENLLGRATTVFTPPTPPPTNALTYIFVVSRETWAYGSKFQLHDAFQSEFPYFLPIRFRLFRPDDDDVAVEFDAEGRVSAIKIPKAHGAPE